MLLKYTWLNSTSWDCTILAIYLHYTCTILALYLHYTSTILALYLHYTCTILALYLHYTCTILALYLHYTCTILALYLHYTCTILALCLHYTCTILALYLHYTCTILAIYLHYTCTIMHYTVLLTVERVCYLLCCFWIGTTSTAEGNFWLIIDLAYDLYPWLYRTVDCADLCCLDVFGNCSMTCTENLNQENLWNIHSHPHPPPHTAHAQTQ